MTLTLPRAPARNSLLLIIAALVLSGCASMNKNECLNADWRIIGMEDGARGEPPARIGKHREACAKHGVTPDLASYQSGHKEGLKQFCTASMGFSQGKAGRTYKGVCPSHLEGEFLKGYNAGKEIYALSRKIQQAESRISVIDRDIEALKTQISENEQELIADATTPERRIILLQEIKDKQKKLGELEAERKQLEKEIARSEGELAQLNDRYSF